MKNIVIKPSYITKQCKDDTVDNVETPKSRT